MLGIYIGMMPNYPNNIDAKNAKIYVLWNMPL